MKNLSKTFLLALCSVILFGCTNPNNESEVKVSNFEKKQKCAGQYEDFTTKLDKQVGGLFDEYRIETIFYSPNKDTCIAYYTTYTNVFDASSNWSCFEDVLAYKVLGCFYSYTDENSENYGYTDTPKGINSNEANHYVTYESLDELQSALEEYKEALIK